MIRSTDVFHCDPSLNCSAHIEAIFYASKIQFSRIESCCHCAGESDSPIELNSCLKAPDGPYSVVLPICKMCLDNGCHIIVRGARQTVEVKQAKLDAKVVREIRRQEKDVANKRAATLAEAREEAREEAPTATPSKSRKRNATR